MSDIDILKRMRYEIAISQAANQDMRGNVDFAGNDDLQALTNAIKALEQNAVLSLPLLK